MMFYSRATRVFLIVIAMLLVEGIAAKGVVANGPSTTIIKTFYGNCMTEAWVEEALFYHQLVNSNVFEVVSVEILHDAPFVTGWKLTVAYTLESKTTGGASSFAFEQTYRFEACDPVRAKALQDARQGAWGAYADAAAELRSICTIREQVPAVIGWAGKQDAEGNFCVRYVLQVTYTVTNN